MSELSRKDFLARWDGQRLEVLPKPKWLQTLGLGAVAVALSVAGLAGMVMSIKSSWAGLAMGVPLAVFVGLRIHQFRAARFSLDRTDGARSISFDWLKREARHVPADQLAAGAGEVEVYVSDAPGSMTVEGKSASVMLFVHSAGKRRWMFSVSTVESRARELESFVARAFAEW